MTVEKHFFFPPMDWDLRILERRLRVSKISLQDIQKYVDALPDVAHQAAPIPLVQPGMEPDEEEDVEG
ncbi:hypothetical protein [Pajaroellobacter abortibovis]|uniref:Uncharacterized protein n=1 Tax=Pajaroellobacter abortibovis TaxID=1882918 RepID=A0A1L6MVY6_9BACT|nr:hypothetical protein [Pajaroellobacter abortibovis]APR99692.1 hypothetical protein BCY86_02635 [Pajaroellobacter abortibovis]